MRFYYLSIFSLLLLGVIYFIGTGLLVWFGSWLRRRWKRAWVLMVPLFVLLLIAPVAEELWIAWNFGQLCKKDAGIFVNKTVEVEGYYDATAGLLQVYNPVDPRTAKAFDERGYKFYEMSLSDPRGGPTRVVHFEKLHGEWTPTVLDHPTAKYHFNMDSGLKVTHGVWSQTAAVRDAQSEALVARYTRYNREAPWFFIGLDRPRIACDGPDGGPNLKHSFLIYQDVLKPRPVRGSDNQ
jgi:hypothetical protein